MATIVMLAAMGCLAGRRWVDRLAWSAVGFGAWDLFYYFWLWVFVGWPPSLDTWDLLFLIPVPWAGPVWAPMVVSLALVGTGLAAARQVGQGRMPQTDVARAVAAVAGGVLVVCSFTLDAPALMAGGMPGWYPWPLFVAGMALAGLSAASVLRAGTRTAHASGSGAVDGA